MTVVRFLVLAITIAAGIALSTEARAANTVDAGDASTSWMGTGQIHDIGDGQQIVNGLLRGVMFIRHFKGSIRGPIHAAKLECPVRVKIDRKNDRAESTGLCTIIAHEGKDIAYAQWLCKGPLDECEGQFRFTGGAGGFQGISGEVAFRNRVDIERQEGGKVEAFGYAHWPSLTYTLPGA